MKIIVTGTHLTPALAVMEELKKDPNTEIIYVGRLRTMEGDKTKSVESQVLENLGIKFIPIISGRLQRNFSLHLITSLLKIPIGLLQSIYYVFKENPDVLLSFGGYISVPVTISAWLHSTPIIVHEQTLIPGIANTVNSWFANKIAVSFLENVSYKKEKIVLTGNPLRDEIFNYKNSDDMELKEIINLADKNKQPLILITGGNQGSHAINQVISKSLGSLTQMAFVIHQTGDSKFADFDKLSSRKDTLKNPEKYLVRKWINGNDWGYLLKHVDLAISRGGINTLLEFSYNNIPAIIIPLSNVNNGEQMFNAKFFAKVGLTKILFQKNLNEETLIQNISEIVKNLDDWKKSAKQSSKFVIKDAAKRLALEVILLAKKRS